MGRRLAGLLRPGDVVLLAGELGAGKTVFAGGIGEGLGVEDPVVSPTFVLVRSYRGLMPMTHADIYRLGSSAELEDLDLPAEAEEGVLVVEWGDAVEQAFGEDHLLVRFVVGDDESRDLELVPRVVGNPSIARGCRLRIVAVEAATASSSVALVDRGGVVASARRIDRRGHIGFLVPALHFCFSQAGWKPADIDVVAVDVGPGLFSGIRAGLATAQALAGAVGVPPDSGEFARRGGTRGGHRPSTRVVGGGRPSR